MRRFFGFVTSHPVPVLVAAALIALAVGSGLFRLTRDTNPDAFIPADHPALTRKAEVDAFFGLTEPIAVGIFRDAPGGIFNPHTLALVRDLTEAIAALPHLTGADVISLATEFGVAFHEGEPGFERLMQTVPTDAAGCAALEQDVLSYELFSGTLVAADRSATCILIRLPGETDAENVYHSLRDLLARVPVRDERVLVAGGPIVRAHFGQAVSDDALRMNFVSPVVMCMLLVLAYRTVRGTLLPLGVIGGASAVALGSMGWSGVPVYIVTNGIFVVIMALSVAYALHWLSQYYEEQLRPRGRTRQELVVDASLAVWYPVLVTSATDGAGFLAIYFTGGMPPIQYFGWFTCLGVLGALVFAYIVLPAGLVLRPLKLSPVFTRHARLGNLDAAGTLLGRLGTFVFHHRGAVLLAGGGLLAAAGWGASRLVVNDARILAFKEQHPLVQAARALNARFDGTSELHVVVSAAERGALLEPATLRRIEALEAFTETLPHVGGTHSLAGWVKRAHQKMNGDRPEFYTIPTDPEDTRFYLDTLSAPTSPMARHLLEAVDPTYTVANLVVRLRSSEFVHERAAIRALESHLAEQFPDQSLRTELAGRVHLDYHWLRLVKRSHVLGVAFSGACAFLLTALMFRSLWAGVLCTLTVGAVVLIDYAVMGWAHIPLGVGTSMSASIAIGVGVNPSIHLLDRLRLGLREPGADPARVFTQALEFTGRALFFAAFVLVAGFLLLCVSEFRTLVEFGLLIGLSIATSFLLSITLLPALVAIARPRFLWPI